MNDLVHVALVARREMRERSRSKGFRISFVVVLLGVVGLAVAPAFFDSTSTSEVGVVGPAPSGFGATLAAIHADDRVTVTSYPDATAGENAVRDGDVDVLWEPGAGQLVWKENEDPTLGAQVRAAATRAQFDANAAGLGLSDAQQQQLLSPPGTATRLLEPVDDDQGARVALAVGGTILLFIAIQTFGGFVMTSVITEKTSRIAEILLAQVKASSLLAGKVIGVGALALIELVAIGVAVLVAGQAAGTVSVPAVGAGAVATTLGFFVLGFTTYATLYAAAGALTNRQEDAQAVTFPVMLPLLAGYLVALVTIADPDNPVSVGLSMFPLTAAVQMPVRLQLGEVPAWQLGLSIALCLGFIGLVLELGGRVYAGGLLRTGSRVKVRDAWRAADDLPPTGQPAERAGPTVRTH